MDVLEDVFDTIESRLAQANLIHIKSDFLTLVRSPDINNSLRYVSRYGNNADVMGFLNRGSFDFLPIGCLSHLKHSIMNMKYRVPAEVGKPLPAIHDDNDVWDIVDPLLSPNQQIQNKDFKPTML